MKILLTGFNSFGSLAVNPSQVIVEEYARRHRVPFDWHVFAAVLETSYAIAEKQIVELLEEIQPDVLLMFGVAQRSQNLRVERQAINLDNASIPDNSGDLRITQPISPAGPATYPVTVSASGLLEALQRESIPAEFSDDAGAFVCNHTLYAALRHCAEQLRMTQCGFIHIPLPTERCDPHSTSSPLTFADLLRGVDACVRFVQASAIRS